MQLKSLYGKCTVEYNLSIDIVHVQIHMYWTHTSRIPVIRIVAQLAALTVLFALATIDQLKLMSS